MEISNFDELLHTALQQPEPQRLLFVFAGAELPADATPEQRARFEAGQGGELTPLMCVDKAPQELESFAALVEESRQHGPDWALVFVAALTGRDGQVPTSSDAETPLRQMVAAIRAGSIGSFAVFDRLGQAVRLR